MVILGKVFQRKQKILLLNHSSQKLTLHGDFLFLCKKLNFRCAIPNEHLGNIEFIIFPLVAQLNVQRLCQIIANQLSISNNEEYGL